LFILAAGDLFSQLPRTVGRTVNHPLGFPSLDNIINNKKNPLKISCRGRGNRPIGFGADGFRVLGFRVLGFRV
jgi:hypothetical protein